jgi:enterochelin esterase-like enzyme
MNHRRVMAMIVGAAVLAAFVIALGAFAQQGPPAAGTAQPQGAPGRATAPQGRAQGPAVVSPEILSDRRLVFRILAPQAQNVTLRAGDIPAAARGGQNGPEFKKGENGVWEATTGPVDAGAYRYTFSVDGVVVLDPRNTALSESNTALWSVIYVPGSDFMDTKNVPHGAVASVYYYSTALDRTRRMHVYTPPGYEANQQKYPVFYLLHGSGDCDDSWTSEGRANFILDNLIAMKMVKPLMVVLPAGHTTTAAGAGVGRSPAAPAGGAAAAPQAPRRDEFAEDFVNDVMPYVEKNYRVLTDRGSRAIAGLSMGGGQTLNVGFAHLDQFAYLGVYSSGVMGGSGGGDWETSHQATLDNAGLKKGLKLVWFSTGVDDALMARSTKPTVEMLKKHGFAVVFKESPGAHTWINWRNYLNEFTPQLFQ